MKSKKNAQPASEKRIELDFCTECQHQLDEFDLTTKAKDMERVKENFNNCRRIGKFKGEMCSKIFIANSDDSIWNDE